MLPTVGAHIRVMLGVYFLAVGVHDLRLSTAADAPLVPPSALVDNLTLLAPQGVTHRTPQGVTHRTA